MKNKVGSRDWRTLCELASREQDPKKVLDLIKKIDRALEECNRQSGMDHAAIRIDSVLLPANSVTPQSDFDELHGVALQRALIGEYDC